MFHTQAQPGHFYAIGVGPGAPELVTLQAAELVKTADVIFSPQAKTSKKSIALQAVERFVDQQEVVVSSYPMTRHNESTRAHWGQIADDVVERCLKGQSVVQITLGDPNIYATSTYLIDAIAERLPQERIHTAPGISAFQMVSSCFAKPLTLQEDRLLIMPASDIEAVERAIAECETLVLFKAAQKLPQLLDLLEKHNLLETTSMVSGGGQGEEELRVADLSQWDRAKLGYMTTMIIRIGNRAWQEGEA